MHYKHSFFVLVMFPFYLLSVVTSTGLRDWQNAALLVEHERTIISKLDQLTSDQGADFPGTFTLLDSLQAKMNIGQSLIDILEVQDQNAFAQAKTIESKLCGLESNVELLSDASESQLDFSGVFTALEGLEDTICSKFDIIFDDLSVIDNQIMVITATAQIDFVATITTLDALSVKLMESLTIINDASQSLTEDLEGLEDYLISAKDQIETVNSKVDVLVQTTQDGFAGTFTALEPVLSKACLIESLIDDMQSAVVIDLNGTFTMLAAIEQIACTMESKVEQLAINVNVVSELDLVDSIVDENLRTICTADSNLDVLIPLAESVQDDIIDVASAFDGNESILDLILDQQKTIESKLEHSCQNASVVDGLMQIVIDRAVMIESGLDNAQSLVDLIGMSSDKLVTIESVVDVIHMQVSTISSKVEVIAGEQLTIDSLIDVLQISSLTVFDKLCTTESTLDVIDSILDVFDPVFNTIESKLERIDVVVKTINSNMDVIDSTLDVAESKISALQVLALLHKICTIDSFVDVVDSDVDVLQSVIDNTQIKVGNLSDDFVGTWTLLDSILQKVCTSESIMEVVNSKTDLLIEEVSDIDTTFTVIEEIYQKDCTIESGIDRALSLLDTIDVDFSGTFTALDGLLEKVCTVASQVEELTDHAEELLSPCGVGIRQVDLVDTYTITQPGRYFLEGHIQFTAPAQDVSAIVIDSDDVYFDLSGRTMRQINALTGSFGVEVLTGHENITIANGVIDSFTEGGIHVGTNCSYITLDRVKVNNCGTIGDIGILGDNGVEFDTGCSNIVLDNCIVNNNAGDGIVIIGSTGSPCTDVLINRCIVRDNASSGLLLRDVIRSVIVETIATGNQMGLLAGYTVTTTSGLVVRGCAFNSNTDNGINIDNVDFAKINNCALEANTNDGILIESCSECMILENSIINNGGNGIELNAASINNYVANNRMIINGGSNINELGGPNSFLGNWAVRTVATNNYTLTNSVINSTAISKTTGPIPEVSKWVNVDMTP